jgi:acetyl esterase/lipase
MKPFFQFSILALLISGCKDTPVDIPEAHPFGSTHPCSEYVNVSYVAGGGTLFCGGASSKQVFDMYVPQVSLPGDVPKPLVLFIHGGGFTGGDKNDIFGNPLLVDEAKKILDEGYALALVNYRLLSDCSEENCGVRDKCMDDVVRCLKFIKSQAAFFGIDKERIGMFGVSAGASTALWVGLKGYEGKDISSLFGGALDVEDTNVKAIYTLLTQATLDLEQWDTQVFTGDFGTTDVSLGVLFAELTDSDDCYLHRMHGMGAIYPAALTLGNTQAYRAEIEMLKLLQDMALDSEPPALFIRNDKANDLLATPDADLLNHHPLHSVVLVNKAISSSYPATHLNYWIPGMGSTFEHDGGWSGVADFMIAKL